MLNDELQFDNAASWVRRGRYGLNVTDSVRSLYDQATDGFELGSVVALHTHVRESMQSRSDAFAAELAEADALESRADVALDEARAAGKFREFSAVLYEPPHATLAALNDPEEAARRTFGDSYGSVLMALSGDGVACLDARVGSHHVARRIGERVGLMVERLRENDAEAGSDIIFVVANKYAFEEDTRNLLNTPLYDVAHKKRVFVADVVEVLVANPGVSLDSPLLDGFRPYIAPTDDQVVAWRAQVGRGSPPRVVFNTSINLRTVKAYARELQEKRRAELEAEAARQAAASEAGDQDVHSRKANLSGAFAKKKKRDFAAELKPNGKWDRAALDDLLELFNDEITKGKADSSYKIQWPGNEAHVKTSLNKLIKAAGGEGYGLKRSFELAKHFAKELKKIRDADESESESESEPEPDDLPDDLSQLRELCTQRGVPYNAKDGGERLKTKLRAHA